LERVGMHQPVHIDVTLIWPDGCQLHYHSVVAGRFEKDVGLDGHANVADVLMRQTTQR
jgi:hypothetical protein